MTVEQLQNDPAYQEISRVEHRDIIPFVLEEYQRGGRLVRLFRWLLGLSVLVSVLIAAYYISTGVLPMGRCIMWWLVGALPAMVPVVPLHEGIHGLAYYAFGAQRVQFGAVWSKFYFYAVADRFVVDRVAFWWLALAPFIVINSFCLIAMAFASPVWVTVWSGLLVMHTMACAGDFILLNYMDRQDKPVFTYDELADNQAYFYVKQD